MNRTPRSVVALTVAAAALLPLAACGDDDSAGGSSTTASTTTSAADDGGDAAVTVTASGPIDLKVGERARIELAANPTTGYQWEPTTEPDTAVVKIVSDTYTAEPTDRVGSGGTQVLVVEGVAAGTTTLDLGYIRPWETDTPPAETASFAITVS